MSPRPQPVSAEGEGSPGGAWSLKGPRWRSLARFGATRMPEWFVRASPPAFGLIVWALARGPRRIVADNLRVLRPSRGPIADAIDVARTFTSYAACVTEVLRGAPKGDQPQAIVRGDGHLDLALAEGKGVVLVTAHTAGWEFAGRLLMQDRGLRVMIVERPERDPVARAIQDQAREEQGLLVAHAGDDPLAVLPLLRHLRGGGVVALQIDRVPPGMRSRRVRLFGQPGQVPEGPLRLAAASGAPVVPVFAARTGHWRYEVVVRPALRLSRGASEAELDGAAQALADALEAFVSLRPTQWFHFEGQAAR
jgi:lauroyl/myristoyl acyltransferase